MFKPMMKRLILTLCYLLSLFTLASFYTPHTHAAGPQLTIALPSGFTPPAGHIGTAVTITGSVLLGAGTTLNLYTTTSNDPTKCTNTAPPTNLGLTPFSPPNTTVKPDGTFTLSTTWPASAGTANTAYYICAIPPSPSPNPFSVLSMNNFTVAPPATINITPVSIAVGSQVTITGSNWLPPQAMTVAIVYPSQPSVVASNQVTSDNIGAFNTILTIPANTPPGTYTASVIANNEPTLRVLQNNAVTITVGVTPTPSPSPTPTLVPTPTITPTVAPTATSTGTNNTNNGNGGEASSILVFVLGGLGILLVLVGIVLFIVFSRIG